MTYVDGFVIPVSEDNVEAYKEMATKACGVWMKHGALQYFECVGEDLHPALPEGASEDMKGRYFDELAGAKDGETVIFAFIIYKDRAHRDEVNAKVMADPAMDGSDWKDKPMPFEMSRAAYGGFKAIVEDKQ